MDYNPKFLSCSLSWVLDSAACRSSPKQLRPKMVQVICCPVYNHSKYIYILIGKLLCAGCIKIFLRPLTSGPSDYKNSWNHVLKEVDLSRPSNWTAKMYKARGITNVIYLYILNIVIRIHACIQYILVFPAKIPKEVRFLHTYNIYYFFFLFF